MMNIPDLTGLVKELAPIVAAIASVATVYLGRTIHALVNSAMAAVKEDLRLANERIGQLQTIVTALVEKHPESVSVPSVLMIPPAYPPTIAK